MGNLAYEMYEAWDEMLDGKIVAMSPRPVVDHNIVSGNIYSILRDYFKGKQCSAFGDGVDVHLTPTDRFVPDGMVVCNRDIIKPDGVHGSPDLIIEVLSPRTAKNDKGYKKNVYEACGVKEYWIVDIANKSIEVYLLENGRLELNNVYSIFPDYTLAKMNEEEKASIPMEFSCSLFPELKISIERIFDGMLF